MSLSIFQVLFILFTSFSFSNHNVVIAHSTPSHSFEKTCNIYNVKAVIDPNVCLKILKSQEKIVSSKNQIDFSVAIIESGISNATNTRTYVENKLKKGNLDSHLKGVLHECKLSYDSAIGSFHSALLEVKDRDYQTPTYDLLIASTDNIDRCGKVIASKKINDVTILTGNKVLKMYGFIGFNIIGDLDKQSPPRRN